MRYILFLLFTLSVSAFLTFLLFNLPYGAFFKVNSADKVNFFIQQNETFNSVTQRLLEEEVILNSTLFKVGARLYKFDTEVIKASHGQVISKGGAEGIQCLCKVNEGMGLALKVEDGSKRAKQAVGLHLLKQLDWISELRIQDIEDKVLKFSQGVQLKVKGQLKFQES